MNRSTVMTVHFVNGTPVIRRQPANKTTMAQQHYVASSPHRYQQNGQGFQARNPNMPKPSRDDSYDDGGFTDSDDDLIEKLTSKVKRHKNPRDKRLNPRHTTRRNKTYGSTGLNDDMDEPETSLPSES